MFKKLWNKLANNPVMLTAFLGIVSQVALELQTGLAQMERLTVVGVITLVLGVIVRHFVTPMRKLKAQAQQSAGGSSGGLLIFFVCLVASAPLLSGCTKNGAVDWDSAPHQCVPVPMDLLESATAILLSSNPVLPQVQNLALQTTAASATCAIEAAVAALEAKQARSAAELGALERGRAFLVTAGRR